MACHGIAFQEWAVSQGLTRNGHLEELKGADVAIDADDYVDRLLTDPVTREPLLPALGGLPFALKKHVDSHIKVFKDHNITPRFVFNGVDVATRDHDTIAREARKASDSLNEAWSLYSQSRADDAVAEFGKSCSYRTYHIRRWLTQYLARQDVHCMLAPYSAAAQMVVWKYHLGKCADALVGSIDLLMFGAEKLILDIDFDNKTFKWTTAELVRGKVGLSQEQLVDLCLLSGLTLLPSIADTETSTIESARAQLARANNDGYTACLQAKNDDFTLLFKKAKIAVKHMPVIKSGGKLEPLNIQDGFGDLHDCIGRRLPEEVVYYATRGIAGPRLLGSRTQMEIFEVPPLDGGSSQTYRQLVQQKLVPLRTQALAVLSHRLHRYYHNQDVKLVCWFNESNQRALGVPEAISSLSKTAEQWHVPQSTLDQLPETKEIDLLSSPLRFTIATLSSEANAQKTVTPRPSNNPSQLKTPTEFLANSTWRFLQGRGYIDDKHHLTSWGKAFESALNYANSHGYLESAPTPAEAEEAIFIALELVRLDVLNSSQMFNVPPYSGGPVRGTDADKAATMLISRVACLGTFQHQEIGFTGPLSRHLLAYQQVTAAVRNSLRDLLEMYTVDMLLSAGFSRDIKPTEWSKYGAHLSLLREPDLGLALVVKSYLDELSNEPHRRADISRWFSHAQDIHGDLQTAWKLWGAVNAGVQANDAISGETKTTFKTTDEWLSEKLNSASQPLANGTS